MPVYNSGLQLTTGQQVAIKKSRIERDLSAFI